MIDPRVLRWKAFAASSGPGGQHVNKVATAMELRCRIDDLGLPDGVAARLRVLAGPGKVNKAGELVLVARAHRSLERNRVEVLAKLTGLIVMAARVPKKRRATRPTKGSKQRRVEGKKKRGEVKRLRSSRGE